MFVNSETGWNNGYVPKNGSVNCILKQNGSIKMQQKISSTLMYQI